MLGTETCTHANSLSEFLAVRDRLLRIAHRILGSALDAEDVVQDAWLRWNHADRSVVRNAPAFLCLTTSRLSINAIQSAHIRHQSSLGLPAEWPDFGADPATAVERNDRLRGAMVLLVERLTPRERVAYVLREAFDYPHRKIGDVLGCTEANARQVIRRARARMGTDPTRRASSAEQRRLLRAFLHVARTGDPRALAEVARDPDPA